MRKGEGILAGIIYPSAWYRGKTRVGVTSRERRDASVLALSHRPSRVATDSSCRCKRTNEKEYVYVYPHVFLRVECTVTPAGRVTPFPVISDCQWSPLPLARSRSIDSHASGIENQLSDLIFWSWRGSRSSGGCVVVVHLPARILKATRSSGGAQETLKIHRRPEMSESQGQYCCCGAASAYTRVERGVCGASRGFSVKFRCYSLTLTFSRED